MNGSSLVLAGLLGGLLALPAAMAQTPPPQPAAAAPATPPVPAKKPASHNPPRPQSMLGHSAPGAKVKPAARPTPVVSAPARAHAQKPASAKPRAVAGQAPKAAPAVAREVPKAAPPPAAPAPPPEPPREATAEPTKGSVTAMLLPRWASLKADEVNLRSGPGTRYPIEWVYHRVNLPVQIEREFEVWRLIEDQDGVKGWVHQATLTGRRSFVVKDEERVLRRTASASAPAVARLKPGVVGQIRSCDAKADWCEVQVGEYRGFLRRAEVYGLYPGEGVN